MSHEELPDDEDGMVAEPEPGREAIYVVTIHVRAEQDPIQATIPVCAPEGDHDLVVAEAVADIVASTLEVPPAELVGLGQPSKPGLRGTRGMGWGPRARDPSQRRHPRHGRGRHGVVGRRGPGPDLARRRVPALAVVSSH